MVIKIKQDPLNIAISLIFSLNLLEENKEYNINEIKSLSNLDHHWNTIHKYLQIFNFIQKYSPKLEFSGSKFKIIESKIYQRLSEKEKFVLHLYNNQALDNNRAIPLEIGFDESIISDSIGYLYEKTKENKFYLNKAGLDKFRIIEESLSDLIFNEKNIDDVFGENEYHDIKILDRELKPKIRDLFIGRWNEVAFKNTFEIGSATSTDTMFVPKKPDLTNVELIGTYM